MRLLLGTVLPGFRSCNPPWLRLSERPWDHKPLKRQSLSPWQGLHLCPLSPHLAWPQADDWLASDGKESSREGWPKTGMVAKGPLGKDLGGYRKRGWWTLALQLSHSLSPHSVWMKSPNLLTALLPPAWLKPEIMQEGGAALARIRVPLELSGLGKNA